MLHLSEKLRNLSHDPENALSVYAYATFVCDLCSVYTSKSLLASQLMSFLFSAFSIMACPKKARFASQIMTSIQGGLSDLSRREDGGVYWGGWWVWAYSYLVRYSGLLASFLRCASESFLTACLGIVWVIFSVLKFVLRLGSVCWIDIWFTKLESVFGMLNHLSLKAID